MVTSDSSHIQILTNEIIVTEATLNDDGMYTCQATNAAGTVQAHTVVDIIRKNLFFRFLKIIT